MTGISRFSPFELVYGHTRKGPLKLVVWLNDKPNETLLGNVAKIRNSLLKATNSANKHLFIAQCKDKARAR